MTYGLTGELGRKMAEKMAKMTPKFHLGAIFGRFSRFSAIFFPSFPGEAKIRYSAFFFLL